MLPIEIKPEDISRLFECHNILTKCCKANGFETRFTHDLTVFELINFRNDQINDEFYRSLTAAFSPEAVRRIVHLPSIIQKDEKTFIKMEDFLKKETITTGEIYNNIIKNLPAPPTPPDNIEFNDFCKNILGLKSKDAGSHTKDRRMVLTEGAYKNFLKYDTKTRSEFIKRRADPFIECPKSLDIILCAYFDKQISENEFYSLVFLLDDIRLTRHFPNAKTPVSSQISCLTSHFDPQALQLPSRSKVTKAEFIENPLFSKTKEKETVFKKLCLKMDQTSFLEKYDNFLNHLSREIWFEGYEKEPIELANFALIAFLDKKIDLEELCVIHLVSAAFNKTRPENLQLRVLNGENIQDYLRECNIPPFDTQKQITNSKDEEFLKTEKSALISSFSKRTSVRRTSVEYTLPPSYFNSAYPLLSPLEAHLYFMGYRCGLKERVANVLTAALLPPFFVLDSYKAASKFDLPRAREQGFMFGHSEDVDCFLRGVRPISMASPLFAVPSPHGYKSDNPALHMLFHDLNYHLLLDANIPPDHKLLWANLGAKLRSEPNLTKTSEENNKDLAGLLFDREAFEYKTMNQDAAFIHFIKRQISSLDPTADGKEPEPKEIEEWKNWEQWIYSYINELLKEMESSFQLELTA